MLFNSFMYVEMALGQVGMGEEEDTRTTLSFRLGR